MRRVVYEACRLAINLWLYMHACTHAQPEPRYTYDFLEAP